MLTANYINNSDFVDVECDWQRVVPAAVEKFIHELAGKHKKDSKAIHTKVNYQGLVWVPDWDSHRYVRHYKVKVLTNWQTYVLLICLGKEYGSDIYYEKYPIDAHDRPESMKLARIFNEIRADAPLEALQNPGSQPVNTRLALMRDVHLDDGTLEGPYASVIDTLNVRWPTADEAALDDKNSHMDRLMAYYHTDRIQRYFRTLGLTVLNDYSQLNPVRITLSADRRTAYFSEENRIHFNAIKGTVKHLWTDARSCRTVYHEYVHVVTDSLVRLRRQRKTNSPHARRVEILQAAAMDEGLADYFASSMAAQLGDYAATYRVLKFENNGSTLVWSSEGVDEENVVEENDGENADEENGGESAPVQDTENGSTDEDEHLIRSREFRSLEKGCMNLATPATAKNLPSAIIYDWCQHWARFLWLLRKQLGSEVADRIIANSILFLTRWSSLV
ncbi:MAG: hypothetical protein R2932_07135 [Caldilineaceae bacterium]